MVKVKRNGTKTLNTRIQPATPGDAIVISGISGKFPNAENVAELTQKLNDKVENYIQVSADVLNLNCTAFRVV